MYLTSSSTRRYTVTLLSVMFSLVLMLGISEFVSMTASPFLLFYEAVMLSAWYGGIRPGLSATSLSALASWYFFISPTYSFNLNLLHFIRISLFILQGVFVSILCESLNTT